MQLEKVQVAGQEVAKSAVMVRDDQGNMQLASIQGQQYQLITNSMARDFIDDVISRSDHVWNPLTSHWDGKRFVSLYITQNKIGVIESGEANEIYLGLKVYNSYDGSSCFGLETFAFNIKCSNQYHHRNRFGFFAIRHTPDQTKAFDVQDAIQNISVGTQNVLQSIPSLEDMRNKPLSVPMLTDARSKLPIPSSQWGNVLERLSVEETTKFGLFQAVTWLTTHKMQSISGIHANNDAVQYFINGSSD